MDEIAVLVIRWNRFTKLLERPLRGGVCSDVAMDQSPRRVLHDDEDIQKLERCGDHDAEVARHDRLGVIAKKSRPALIATGTARRPLRNVLRHGTRGDLDPQLDQQLVGNPLLAPGWILGPSWLLSSSGPSRMFQHSDFAQFHYALTIRVIDNGRRFVIRLYYI